jgi:hypothetical protein
VQNIMMVLFLKLPKTLFSFVNHEASGCYELMLSNNANNSLSSRHLIS